MQQMIRGSNNSNAIGFRSLLLALAHLVGEQHVVVNVKAHDIADFLLDGAVHDELIRPVFKRWYKRCGCTHLNGKMSLNTALDVLGEARAEHIQKDTADITAFMLLDEIGEHIAEIQRSLESGMPVVL